MAVQAVEVEEISQNPGTEVTWILGTTLTNRHRIRRIIKNEVFQWLASCRLSLLTGHRANWENWIGNWKTLISCPILCTITVYNIPV